MRRYCAFIVLLVTSLITFGCTTIPSNEVSIEQTMSSAPSLETIDRKAASGETVFRNINDQTQSSFDGNIGCDSKSAQEYISNSTTRLVKAIEECSEKQFARCEARKRPPEEVKYLQKCAEQGDVVFMHLLGSEFQYGEKNFTKAIEWYRKAAVQGFGVSQNKLASLYYEGKGVTKNSEVALFWWRMAAEQGNVEAQDAIQTAYLKGEKAYADEAVKWWRKAAEGGNTSAQSLLGYAYSKGEGVTRNYAEAAKWWRKAAEDGNKYAQDALGDVYSKGEGVTRNYAEAAKWWRKAAEQGYKYAQVSLGVAYSLGQGVNRDFVIAYMWFSLAAAQGVPNTKEMLDQLSRRAKLGVSCRVRVLVG